VPDLTDHQPEDFEQLPLFVLELVRKGTQVMHNFGDGVLFHDAHFRCSFCGTDTSASAHP
jgi:hypothetical protein